MKILNYINFINQTIHENNSSLSFYKINERATTDGVVDVWPEVDLVKFRLLNKDSEASLKLYLKEKFVQAIYELLTKNPNLYKNSQTEVDKKLNTNFIKTKTETWTYKKIGGWIETRWNNLVFLPTSFIEAQDKEYLPKIEKDIWQKERHVLNGRSSSDAIMSNFIYNYKSELEKNLDSENVEGYIFKSDMNQDLDTLTAIYSEYWKTDTLKL
jgi:hypothetical protein